jgi:large-conductance mechanosensitive channel
MQTADPYDTSFKFFITKNGIIAAAAGITIGFATATFFKSLVADMILPVFFMLFVKGTSKVSRSTGSFFAQFLSNKEFRFINFVSELITWILIILVSWLLISAINKFVVGQASVVGSLKNMNPFHKEDSGTFQETSAEAFMQQQKMQMQNAWNAEMYANENDASASAMQMQQMQQLAASTYGMPKKAVTEETPMSVPEGFVEASTSGSGRGCSRDLAPF